MRVTSYRDDLEAAKLHIDALETDLLARDERIEALEAELREATAEIERLAKLAPAPPPPSAPKRGRGRTALVGLVGVVAGAALALTLVPAESPPPPVVIEQDPIAPVAPVTFSPRPPDRPRAMFAPSGGDDDGDDENPIKRALERGRTAARACPGLDDERGTVRLTYGPDGEVAKIRVEPPYAGTSAEACIFAAYRAAPLGTRTGRSLSATSMF